MPSPVGPIALLDALLLRQRLPDLVLRPGQALVARVASKGPEGAALVIAGELVKATVPEDVPAGATLRLTVDEVGAERVVLRLDGFTPPLPARVEERAVPAPARERTAVAALRYETEALGALAIRVETGPSGTRARIEVPPHVLTLARERASELRGMQVEIVGRGIDAYA